MILRKLWLVLLFLTPQANPPAMNANTSSAAASSNSLANLNLVAMISTGLTMVYFVATSLI